MQHTNGSAIRNDHVQSFPETNASGNQSTPERWTSEPPAKELPNGRVITRVWANPNHWGDITWRVDQIRIRHGNQPRLERGEEPASGRSARCYAGTVSGSAMDSENRATTILAFIDMETLVKK